jgi:hypothetical protein
MSEREKVIDFTYPYYEGVGILVMMKKLDVTPSIFRSFFLLTFFRGRS